MSRLDMQASGLSHKHTLLLDPPVPDSKSRIRVAIVDPAPVYRHGLGSALSDAGFAVCTANEPHQWSQRTESGVLITTLLDREDYRFFDQTCQQRDRSCVLVGLVAEPIPELFAEVLRLGGDGVAARNDPPADIVAAVNDAIRGVCRLPTPIAMSMSASALPAWSLVQLTPEETNWIRQLAEGRTVLAVARAAGYSERMMYRLLASLYSRMGVSNRMEAIAYSAKARLLD